MSERTAGTQFNTTFINKIPTVQSTSLDKDGAN